MPRATASRVDSLAYAAYLYYVHNLDQSAVARRLNVSRSNVSRMLSAARELGIVRFHVAYEPTRAHDLEEQLVDRYRVHGLEEVLVVQAPSVEPADQDLRERAPEASRRLGEEDADSASLDPAVLALVQAVTGWLSVHLTDGIRLGLSWGGTIQEIVDASRFDRLRDVHVVQLAGELSLNPRHSGHDLTRDLANKLGGRYTYFNAPAILERAEGAVRLRQSPQVAQALDLARQVDIAMLGLGAFGEGTSLLFMKQAGATPEEWEEARHRGVVGQVCGRFFDHSGRQARLTLHRRVLSLELDELRQIPTVLAVATGVNKANAVQAALRGSLINVLACDLALARALLGAPPRRPTSDDGQRT